MNYWWLLIPFLSAAAGWLIHRGAATLLFHPRTPKQFPGFSIQGLIPKHRHTFTQQLGSYAAAEFQAMDMIEKKISDPATLAKVIPVIEVHVDEFLRVKLAEKMPMISMFIGDKTINSLKTVFLQELENLFPKVMGQFAGNLRSELNIEKLITDKLSAITDEELEAKIRAGMGAILRSFYMLGAFTGLIAGLIALVSLLLLK